MEINSNILAWKIAWTEEPVGLQCMGLQELDMTQWLNYKNTQGTQVICLGTFGIPLPKGHQP